MYIWQQQDWPHFRWDASALLKPLATAYQKQGRLLGMMTSLGFELQRGAHLGVLTEEALKSSEIEGEILDRGSVRSSIARRLGVPQAAEAPTDQRAEGIAEMLLDATEHFDQPLTPERLWGWQAALFPTGRSGLRQVRTGAWRDDAEGPMQVVSGAMGHERVHFEAPAASSVETEMQGFLNWLNHTGELDGLLRAGLAHLWFVTIHPFDDGNGRVARAITDQALAQSERSGRRFYSMSSQIRNERSEYHRALEQAQHRDLDVTDWLVWFLGCFSRALDAAEVLCAAVLRRANFWRQHADVTFTDRQKKVLNRYLDGFEGALTAKKWAAIGKCSPATALRDINGLLALRVLRRLPGGSKNTSYDLASD